MREIVISGREKLIIENVIFDFNGTLAVGGKLIDGVKDALDKLKEFNVYITSADTYGTLREQFENSEITISIVKTKEEKLELIENLGVDKTIAIGNGSIDSLMIREAAIGIAVMEAEGVSTKTMMHADIIVQSIFHAFDMLLDTNKLIATLRE